MNLVALAGKNGAYNDCYYTAVSQRVRHACVNDRASIIVLARRRNIRRSTVN